MNEDYTKQKWNAASGMGAASRIEQILRAKFDKSMEWIKKIKVLRLYFDSNLGSNLEDEAFIAVSDAIYNTLKGIPNIKFFSNFRIVGMTIAHVVCKRLYLLKLIYHANTGRITKDEFCELAAKHLAVETAMLIHKLWDVTVKALPFLLLTLGATLSTASSPWIAAIGVYISAYPEVANIISQIMDHFTIIVKENISKEKMEKLLPAVIDYTLKSARDVLTTMEKYYLKVKELYEKVCEKFRLKKINVSKRSESSYKQKGGIVIMSEGMNYKEAEIESGGMNYKEAEIEGGGMNYKEAEIEGGGMNYKEAEIESGGMNYKEAEIESGSISQSIPNHPIDKNGKLYKEVNK